MKTKIYILTLITLIGFMSCEKPLTDDEINKGNVTLNFSPYTTSSFTRSGTNGVFSKMALMLFDKNGDKVFDKTKTQTTDDDNFGTYNLNLPEGTYDIVCVGHSSAVTPSIKSKEQVQFTASNGRKLTDTFNYYGSITIGEESQTFDLVMNRVVAMFRLVPTDEEIPTSIVKIKFDYTGGSANYNPVTTYGYTKSTQSEIRNIDEPLEVYTFPYLSITGTLKITVSALDEEDNIICKKTFDYVPITVNKITQYKGKFFDGVSGEVGKSNLNFTVNSDWAGTDTYEF